MIRSKARAYLVGLQSGRDPGIEQKFRRWYEADPRHAAAFDSVRRNFDQAGLLRQSPRSRGRGLERHRGGVGATPAYAWAAAAAVVLLVPAAWLLLERGVFVSDTNAVMLVTRVGEIRQVDLDDGSKVTLDTATALEVDVGHAHRHARVKHGRARFEIAKGSAPFVIEAGGMTVSSKGSVIDVSAEDSENQVTVVSGDATVRDSGAAASAGRTVSAGDGLIASNGELRPAQAVAGGSGWTRGMLEFDGTALPTAVELANRYSAQKIVLSGDLGQLRVTGAFHAGDVAGFAKALEAAFHLSLATGADGNLILSAPATPASRNKNGG